MPSDKLMGVTFNLQGKIRADKETNCFVAYCPALNIYSAGKTRPEAKEALTDAAHLFISLTYERGTLDRSLRNLGFGAAQAGPANPLTSSQEQYIRLAVERTLDMSNDSSEYDDIFPVDVPLHLVAAARSIEACPQ